MVLILSLHLVNLGSILIADLANKLPDLATAYPHPTHWGGPIGPADPIVAWLDDLHQYIFAILCDDPLRNSRRNVELKTHDLKLKRPGFP